MQEQESLPLQLRIGGVYVARNGAQFGPLEYFLSGGETYFWEAGWKKSQGVWWFGNGRYAPSKVIEHPHDLVREIGVLPTATMKDEQRDALEELARELLPLIIQREELGPLNAADLAFEYALAFFQRADQN